MYNGYIIYLYITVFVSSLLCSLSLTIIGGKTEIKILENERKQKTVEENANREKQKIIYTLERWLKYEEYENKDINKVNNW